VTSAPVKPRALKRGDIVGVMAPAAAVERDYLERGVSVLGAMGFRVRVSAHVLDRDGILAGTDRDRAGELQALFADGEVRAVFAARGGYGCGRLLPLLDFEAIARTPKPFIGFSDATFVLNALVERGRMVAFHGPMVAMDFARGLGPRSLEHMRMLLGGELDGFEMQAPEALHPGSAEGELMGGCMSVLTAMVGTPWAPAFDGKILFLEDTGEKAYRVDRMLVQLRQAGALQRCAGIVVGAIRPLDGDEREGRLIARFVAEQTRGLGCPVLFGIEAGHGTENLTLPLGVRAAIDSKSRRLIVMEGAVS
jgi:muramoyltetrapeptide carboxypeptidase